MIDAFGRGALFVTRNAFPPLSMKRLGLLLLGMAAPLCGGEQADGTAKMAERLAAIAVDYKGKPHGYLNGVLAENYREKLRQKELNKIDEFYQRYRLAQNLIRDNQNLEAIDEIDRMLEVVDAIPEEDAAKIRPTLNKMKALAWLRHGEYQNCILRHNHQSCLFPIRRAGEHELKKGSAHAFNLLLAEHEANPFDLEANWLLNIAAMTLGKFPDEVPPLAKFPSWSLASDYDIGTFPNIAMQAGVDVMGLSGGGILTDMNGDRHLDLVVSSWSLEDQVRYFENRGDGTFKDQTEQAGLSGITGGLNMVYADFDNSGHPDVLVLRGAWLASHGYQPNSLLRNNGDGTFADVSEEAGLLSFHPTQTAAWLDFDNDGWLDLFIGNESTLSSRHACQLYRNNGDGTFTEMADAAGLAIYAYVKGVAAGDYNNDGRPDLYVSVLDDVNRLYRNDGPDEDGNWSFTEVAAEAGVQEPVNSFPAWFWDYDNDGHRDLFVAGYSVDGLADIGAVLYNLPSNVETPRIYRNRGDGTFEDVSQEMGLEQAWLPMGVNFGDLDNDGYQDFYLGTGDVPMNLVIPNKMYRNDAGETFQDVTSSGGFGHLQKGHAVSFGDIDHDGDQDVHIVMGGAYSGDRYMNALFKNPGHGNDWLKLKLEGVQSNRSGFGARIRLEVVTAEGAARDIHRTAGTGGSFGGNPARLEIGLGKAKAIRELKIFWPASGTAQRFRDIEPNQFLKIREGEARLETVESGQ